MRRIMIHGGIALVMLAGCGEPKFTAGTALTICQYALKKISLDPDNAQIPYVENFGTGDEFYFAWGASTRIARMRNGIGLDVAVTASCIVDKQSREIKSLTLNGKKII
jgi:hypothetical protein